MEEKLQKLVDEFEEINKQIVDPEVISNQPEYKKLTIRRAELEPAVELFTKYKEIKTNVTDAKELLNDESDQEMTDYYKKEIEAGPNLKN